DITNRGEKHAIDFGGVASTRAQLSPDGQRLAIVSWTDQEPFKPIKVAVYELATGKRQDIDARLSRDSNLTWSPDGKRLLVTSQTGTESAINIYDTATGRLSASLSTADQLGRREQWNSWATATRPVFSPDGRRVADVTSTRQSRVIKVWDAE